MVQKFWSKGLMGRNLEAVMGEYVRLHWILQWILEQYTVTVLQWITIGQ